MDWTEERVRKETGWKAFREGKAIAERGGIEGFSERGEILTGSFREGRRKIRTVVRRGGHLSVECACAANRSTGEVCAHGVALLLHAVAKEAEAEKPAPAEVASKPRDGVLAACRIHFAENFDRTLPSGKLGIRVERIEAEPEQADAALSLWLSEHAPGRQFPKLLSLGRQEIGDFLTTIAGHPRISCGGKRVVVSGDPHPPLELAGSERRGNRVRLKIGSDRKALPVRVAEGIGLMTREGAGWLIGALPVMGPSKGWCDEAVELLESGSLDLDLGAYVREADSWLDLFRSPMPGWLGRLRFEAAPLTLSLRLEGSLNALDAEASFSYPGSGDLPLEAQPGEVRGLPMIAGEETLAMRAVRDERAAFEKLRALGFRESGRAGGFQMRVADQVVAFLSDDLPALRRNWHVRIGPRLEHVLKSLHVVRPRLDSQQDLLWDLSFQTDAGKAIPGQKVRELLRSGKRSVRTSNGATVAISREVDETVEPLLSDLGIPTAEGKIQASRAHDYLFRALRKKEGKQLQICAEESIENIAAPSALRAELRSYQLEGYRWLVNRLESLSGALLADDMGLGKTIQTIATIVRFKHGVGSLPVLVLVPTSLLGNWREEIARFAPGLRVVVLHGVDRDGLRDEAGGADVVITSYGTLCRDLAYHLGREYGLLVADEASLLRNPGSEVSRSVAKLKAGRRLALTGTPVENRLRDLWSIFRFVAPGYLGGRDEFIERYESDGAPGSRERLRMRISPFVLRRTKSEVAKDLPEKDTIDEWLQLDDESRALYQQVAAAGVEKMEAMDPKSSGARMHLLTLLLRLRQLCLDPRLLDSELQAGSKSKRLIELVSERVENDGKTLVFSQFREYLHKIANTESGQFGRVFVLDGSTRNRGDLVREFQDHQGAATFFISLKAGGYGLNLTAADTVVHMDPWWNPAVEEQASDRAHRIGQTQPVTVYRLLTRDTVEERVRRLQESKRALIDSINGSDAAPGNWTEADLRSLIS